MEQFKNYDELNINLGEVYTPDKLSSFVSTIIIQEFLKNKNINNECLAVLDPACGDGSLLDGIQRTIYSKEIDKRFSNIKLHGVDINNNSIEIAKKRFENDKNINFEWFTMDSIVPRKGETYKDGWSLKANKQYDVIVTNPPWGADLMHSKLDLQLAGYINTAGQLDSYYLFVELCYNLLNENGICIMILPDSIFGLEATDIRKFLVENTELKLVSRLGEKIFSGINRATSLIMFKRSKRITDVYVDCFRLDPYSKNKYLKDELTLHQAYKNNHHLVLQSRFLYNSGYEFDIDIRENETSLISKIKESCIVWDKYFDYGRGVEVSKNGDIVRCTHCGNWQGITKKQYEVGCKKCIRCNENTDISNMNTENLVSRNITTTHSIEFLVGENIKRFEIDNNRYIKMGYQGINYKDEKIYPLKKLLIRKTGLGINAVIDYAGYVISQTIYYYILKETEDLDLEYVIGVLNSRVLFYYYLKKFGENEWKSHPYLTHTIIKDLPIKAVQVNNKDIASKISNLVKEMSKTGYSQSLDIEIEKHVMKLYGLNNVEIKLIIDEINMLPDLGAINHMKIEIGVL